MADPDDKPARAELVAARDDLRRQIALLATPSRSYDQILNEGMIDKLKNMVREIDEILAGSSHT
ncbi:MAG: hypothetical protein ACXWLZ_07460 [Rhizomicrobium sp.]